MRTVTALVPRSPAACWRVFTSAQYLTAWVPGLRRARVVTTNADGLPREIQFEFAASLTYSLLYDYDAEAREVRWEPRIGRRDAVRGFARFDAAIGGTEVTYGLDQGNGRSEAERAMAAPEVLIASFVRWMNDERE